MSNARIVSRTMTMAAAAIVLSGCAAFTGKADPWMLEKLRTRAAFDMQCAVDQLNITETGQWTYGVQGCGKQTTYTMHACDTIMRRCTYKMEGGVVEIE